MKRQLLKTLAFFCLLTYVFRISSNAQIVYTDVKPDSVVTCLKEFCVEGGDNKYNCSNSFDLDLNNDSSNDYKIHFTYSCSSGKKGGSSLEYKTTISPFHANTVASDGQYPLPMNEGNIISALLNWQVSSTLYDESVTCNSEFGCWGSSSGKWDSGLVKYLGLKLISGGKTYYGWARLNVVAGYFTIYDYAYNRIPDSSILAGDTGGIATGIFSPKHQADFSVFPNPASDKITLSFSTSEKRGIQITNVFGQVVFAGKINSAKQEIGVAELPSGIYVVSAQTPAIKIESKFLKQ